MREINARERTKFFKLVKSDLLNASQTNFIFVHIFFQAEDGIRDGHVTGVQTCALPIFELEGLAAGAATIGCCAQMIGFATISYKDNGLKGVLALGLGTSMLQMPNIYKNWKVWIPPTLSEIGRAHV